ncbi:MAG: hypothetical protein AB9888_04395 [Bacteroidales bacterium]
MKKIRLISPVISLFLITLMLAGSFGFTLIHHTCFHCGTDETIATMTGDPVVENCCGHHESGACSQGKCDMHHQHSSCAPVFSNDCCTHNAERIVTDELVRAEKQSEIIPYFHAAVVIAVIDDQPVTGMHWNNANISFHCSWDLITIHCRLQS